ncbi:MAG: YihY/virulence factor BrkB family protein [Bacillota bacterium]
MKATPFWHPRALFALAKRSVSAWSDHRAASMGAALAFYSLLSLAPLLILVIAIAGLFIGRDEAQRLLLAQVGGLVGDTGAKGISNLLDSVDTRRDGLIATVVSGVTLVLGATTVFAELQADVDQIWGEKAGKASGIWSLIRQRFLSFGLVLTLAFLLLVSLVMSAMVAALGQTWFGGFEALLHAIELALSFVVLTATFALIYKFLPTAKVAWGDVWVGAAVTALLFTIGKFAIGLYLGKTNAASSFGSAGTLVVVILWVYYSAQIYFLGTEFTHEYALAHGSRRGRGRLEPANSDFVAEDPLVQRAKRLVKGNDPVLLHSRRKK